MAVAESAAPFASWAIVELMGHRRIVGYASDIEIAGGKLLRVDVPARGNEPAYSQFYGSQAIYCLSPVSEAVARAMIAAADTRPWYAYALAEREALPSPHPEPSSKDEGALGEGGDGEDAAGFEVDVDA